MLPRLKTVGDAPVEYDEESGLITKIGSKDVLYDLSGRIARIGGAVVYHSEDPHCLASVGEDKVTYEGRYINQIGDEAVVYHTSSYFPQSQHLILADLDLSISQFDTLSTVENSPERLPPRLTVLGQAFIKSATQPALSSASSLAEQISTQRKMTGESHVSTTSHPSGTLHFEGGSHMVLTSLKASTISEDKKQDVSLLATDIPFIFRTEVALTRTRSLSESKSKKSFNEKEAFERLNRDYKAGGCLLVRVDAQLPSVLTLNYLTDSKQEKTCRMAIFVNEGWKKLDWRYQFKHSLKITPELANQNLGSLLLLIEKESHLSYMKIVIPTKEEVTTLPHYQQYTLEQAKEIYDKALAQEAPLSTEERQSTTMRASGWFSFYPSSRPSTQPPSPQPTEDKHQRIHSGQARTEAESIFLKDPLKNMTGQSISKNVRESAKGPKQLEGNGEAAHGSVFSCCRIC